jgi:trk system potassium uptake protein
MDVRISLRDLAAILQMMSLVLLLPLAATLAYNTESSLGGFLGRCWAFVLPSITLYGLYGLCVAVGSDGSPKTKNIMLTVAMAWMIIALVGAVPFIMRGALTPLNAFFESMSGWTTTGFSMISDFESFDRDLLLFRGLMQGAGGLGVICLGMMVMLHGSNIAVGYTDVGIQKIKPGIRHTIMESFKIYLLYILLGVVLLYIAGMSLFDAVNHSMAAMATGGFSTHVDIGYYDSIPIELILMVLMFLGMTSFYVHYRLFNGDWRALRSEEVKYYVMVIVASIAIIALSVWGKAIPGVDTLSPFDILRKTSFHVMSGMSTCGFNTVDFGRWPDFSKTVLVALLYIGGMSSSTAGGIRVVRFVIILKAIHYSLKRLVLPKTSIVVMKFDGRALKEDLIAVVGYSAVYLGICVVLAMGLMLLGYGGLDSVFTIMSSMGNAGLGVLSGDLWLRMPDVGKLIVILGMWVGRIEIYPALLLLRALMDRLRVA